jgi:hypothetical protein
VLSMLLLLLGSLVGEQGQAQDILDWIADPHFFLFLFRTYTNGNFFLPDLPADLCLLIVPRALDSIMDFTVQLHLCQADRQTDRQTV